MAVTVLFAVIGVGLVALRHSSYGRRLTAMKDSPAASATLGQSMVRLKLSVFMLSAAIAGVGGALMTPQLGSANLDRFDIFLSLSLLMLTVVGGIGYVSGALFGGILFGVAFVALQNTFDKLGADYPDLEGVVRLPGAAHDRAAGAHGRQHRPQPQRRRRPDRRGLRRAAPRQARGAWPGAQPWRWGTCWPAATASATGGSSCSSDW